MGRASEMDQRASYPLADNWRAPLALLLLRCTIGYFFIVWGGNKLITPSQTSAIFEYFYDISISEQLPIGLGIAQIALAIAIVLGIWRRPIYLLGLLTHTMTIIVIAKFLIHPFQLEDDFPVNRVYAASLPAWGAFLALYLLRKYDCWTIGSLLRKRTVEHS
jgi:uncharacterized membrane protein YphA (DoxX/SURF4 family)